MEKSLAEYNLIRHSERVSLLTHEVIFLTKLQRVINSKVSASVKVNKIENELRLRKLKCERDEKVSRIFLERKLRRQPGLYPHNDDRKLKSLG